MHNFLFLFMKFILLSVVGYIAETIFCFIQDKKFVNRGFLCGPIIPIYGIGCLFLGYFLSSFKDNFLIVVLLGMFITSLLEYVTSYLLEKIFHNKWWDYSNQKFNLNGRICLQNSLLFGLFSPLVVYVLNPYSEKLLEMIPLKLFDIISLLVLIIYLIDTIYSIKIAYNLRDRIILVESLKSQKLAMIPGVLEMKLKKGLDNLKDVSLYPKRLLQSFPNLMSHNEKEFKIMKEYALKAKKNKKNKNVK